MIEALEIGISLALADGVLEGVAAARRDLHAVETAMNAGAVSVQRLREAAAGALGVPQAVVGGAAARSEGAGSPAGAADAASVPLAAPDRQEAEPAAAPASRGVAAPLPAPAPGGPLPPAAAWPEPVVSGGPEASAGLVAQTLRTGAAPALPAPAPAVRPPAVPAAPRAPAIAILRMEQVPAAEQGPPPLVSGIAWELGLAAAPQAGGAAASARPTSQPGARAPAGEQETGSPAPAPGGWMEAVPTTAPAAPVTVQQPAAPRGSGNERGLQTQQAGSGPDGQRRDGTRIEGDVFLDGALVGRWISNFLAREAGRASAGPTGFDARRNPLMPGATVGM